jgi:hypothetical protein
MCYAPDLKELLFEDVEQLENEELEAASPARNLTLPRLKKLMLDGDPLIVWGILIALCPNVAQHFQELVVSPHFPLHGAIYHSLAPDVLHHSCTLVYCRKPSTSRRTAGVDLCRK